MTATTNLAQTNLDLGIHRLASEEAVSIETRLALIALRRNQVETTILERLAEAAEVAPPASGALVVDKQA